jgi:predicted transcriptional regulator
MEDQKKKGNQINIELPEEIAEGTYSNLAIISHSNSEFVVDFVRLLPNVPKAKVKSRIILTPQHAKRLLKALADNVKKFEAQHGMIAGADQPPFPPMNFNTPKAQA